jgi:hypothetical protein
MQITIDIQRNQPLTGTASLDGHAPLAFAGWLELLRVVAELADAPTEQRVPENRQATPQAIGKR